MDEDDEITIRRRFSANGAVEDVTTDADGQITAVYIPDLSSDSEEFLGDYLRDWWGD